MPGYGAFPIINVTKYVQDALYPYVENAHPKVTWLAFHCDQRFDASPVTNADIKAPPESQRYTNRRIEKQNGLTL